MVFLEMRLPGDYTKSPAEGKCRSINICDLSSLGSELLLLHLLLQKASPCGIYSCPDGVALKVPRSIRINQTTV